MSDAAVPHESVDARRSSAASVLTSAAFLAAVALLLANDWLLKPALGNWVTGKLSDVAGLAAFAMFWAAFLPRRRRDVLVATALAFALWKSPASAPVLRLWNSTGAWPVARVVDYTDWLALLVLWPTNAVLARIERRRVARPNRALRRVGAAAAAAVALVSFTATSRLPPPAPITAEAYPMPGTRDEVLAALDSARVSISKRPKHRAEHTADTLDVDVRHPPERWVTLTVELRTLTEHESELRPIYVGHSWPEASTDAVLRAFVVQVVQPVRGSLLARHLGDR